MKFVVAILIAFLLSIVFAALRVASDADDHAETMRDFKEEK